MKRKSQFFLVWLVIGCTAFVILSAASWRKHPVIYNILPEACGKLGCIDAVLNVGDASGQVTTTGFPVTYAVRLTISAADEHRYGANNPLIVYSTEDYPGRHIGTNWNYLGLLSDAGCSIVVAGLVLLIWQRNRVAYKNSRTT